MKWLGHAPERTQQPLMMKPRGTRNEHIALWEKFSASVGFLDNIDSDFQRPTLWHSDLCAKNIFVKKGKITAIIDWEGYWVMPLMFAYQRTCTGDASA